EKKYGNNFIKINDSQKQELLTEIDAEAKKANEKKSEPGKEQPPHYFTLMKQMTLLGFFTSKPGATQVLRYNPVPGKYEGCIDYKEGETSWA
ncbi:MAG TPA: gluconate 2-dehydrogenase subunit 3 family protein, partial [Chitinophagaceae bacterium]|nr:gluconate 2-dehydrogenase subunit 3 family protein [Chitinophagaceae bacterium]